jgi:peroxiredoxin Q/BCP
MIRMLVVAHVPPAPDVEMRSAPRLGALSSHAPSRRPAGLLFHPFLFKNPNQLDEQPGAGMPGTSPRDPSATDFEIPSTGSETFRFSAMRGKSFVIYFYPKDNTPGCTKEGQQFRDLYPEFQKLGVEVFGVSRDSLKSHAGFKAKMGFPFELLSDPDEVACELFAVIKMKNMYGKQVRGIERSTFLIGKDGKIKHEWRGVKVPGHAQEVLETVKKL